MTTSEVLTGKTSEEFQKDSAKAAAYAMIIAVEAEHDVEERERRRQAEAEAEAKKKQREKEKEREALSGGVPSSATAVALSSTSGEGAVSSTQTAGAGEGGDEEEDDEDEGDNPRSFGRLLTRNLATMLMLQLRVPLTDESFAAKQRAHAAFKASLTFLASCDFRKFDAFTKWSKGSGIELEDRAVIKSFR